MLRVAVGTAFLAGVSLHFVLKKLISSRRIPKIVSDRLNLDKYTAVVFDCDGVIWSGASLIPGALEAIHSLRARGKRVFFYTNASASTRAKYVEKFEGLGIQVSPDEIHTSGTSTALYLTSRGFANTNNTGHQQQKRRTKVYVIGSPGVRETLTAAGMDVLQCNHHEQYGTVPRDIKSLDPDPEIGAVVIAFDHCCNYYMIAYAALCLRDPSVLFIATNPDKTAPAGGKNFLPGNGTWVAAVSSACGRNPDVVAGKPNPTGLQLILDLNHIQPSETLMVGDRLDTDIAFGLCAGADTLLVESGCTTRDTGLAAEEWCCPHYIAPSVAVLQA